MATTRSGTGSGEGVLLYYYYGSMESVGGREGVKAWMTANCEDLELRGRVRVAMDGLNCTLGGTMASLRKHCTDLEGFGRETGCFEGIDFKLAESPGSLNAAVETESGFDSLRIQLTEEVVTMGPRAKGVKHDLCAEHLGPQEFHRRVVEEVGEEGDAVLVDVRNVYESRIGRFECEGVSTLVPETRTFTEFPLWVDRHEQDLRGRKIFMYCTGGVRCERASAYLKSKGPAFQECYQLRGGIQRYLEAYPDGGLFRGKNFVFDSRSSVGSAGENATIGRCASCGLAHDDYGERVRCTHCRLLLLLCPSCVSALGSRGSTSRFCEICAAKAAIEPAEQSMEGRRKLRLLCVHGHRQTAKSFRGRTASLRKRLRHLIGEFVYVDAPIEVSQRADGAKCGAPRRTWVDETLAGEEAWRAGVDLVAKEAEGCDGILAFSQGAAVVCAALERSEDLRDKLSFVVLCSGYRPIIDDGRGDEVVRVPSLHIFGGRDCQVDLEKSESLVEIFDSGTRTVLRHDMGHIVPASRTYVEDYARFLAKHAQGGDIGGGDGEDGGGDN